MKSNWFERVFQAFEHASQKNGRREKFKRFFFLLSSNTIPEPFGYKTQNSKNFNKNLTKKRSNFLNFGYIFFAIYLDNLNWTQIQYCKHDSWIVPFCYLEIFNSLKFQLPPFSLNPQNETHYPTSNEY